MWKRKERSRLIIFIFFRKRSEKHPDKLKWTRKHVRKHFILFRSGAEANLTSFTNLFETMYCISIMAAFVHYLLLIKFIDIMFCETKLVCKILGFSDPVALVRYLRVGVEESTCCYLQNQEVK